MFIIIWFHTCIYPSSVPWIVTCTLSKYTWTYTFTKKRATCYLNEIKLHYLFLFRLILCNMPKFWDAEKQAKSHALISEPKQSSLLKQENKPFTSDQVDNLQAKLNKCVLRLCGKGNNVPGLRCVGKSFCRETSQQSCINLEQKLSSLLKRQNKQITSDQVRQANLSKRAFWALWTEGRNAAHRRYVGRSFRSFWAE